MKNKHTAKSGFCNLRILTAFFSVVVLGFLALFALTNPSTRGETTRAAGVTHRAFMKVTPQGVIQSTDIGNSKGTSPAARVAQRPVLSPFGQYDLAVRRRHSYCRWRVDRREQRVGHGFSAVRA